MRTEIITCDCCKAVLNPDTWQDKPRPMRIEIYTPTGNPLGELDEEPGHQDVTLIFPEVCATCSRRIARAVTDIIQRIRGEKSTA